MLLNGLKRVIIPPDSHQICPISPPKGWSTIMLHAQIPISIHLRLWQHHDVDLIMFHHQINNRTPIFPNPSSKSSPSSLPQHLKGFLKGFSITKTIKTIKTIQTIKIFKPQSIKPKVMTRTPAVPPTSSRSPPSRAAAPRMAWTSPPQWPWRCSCPRSCRPASTACYAGSGRVINRWGWWCRGFFGPPKKGEWKSYITWNLSLRWVGGWFLNLFYLIVFPIENLMNYFERERQRGCVCVFLSNI